MPEPRLNAAYYAGPVGAFLRASDDEFYAPLASPHGYTLAPEQQSAWRLQLAVLRDALLDWDATSPSAQGPWIHLEFEIPRLGRRVDAVLVTISCVVPIEFKVGAKKFELLDYDQAWDYGLDLKSFRTPSHVAAIFAIPCATEAPRGDARWKSPHRAELERPRPARPRDQIGESCIAVKVFIYNVLHLRDDTLGGPAATVDHFVVFDEAQRARDTRQLASFMKCKKGLARFTQIEPDVLHSAMGRHADWAAVVCLVVGGQEINTGAAGISAWLESLRSVFPGRGVFISPNLTDSEYPATGAISQHTGSRGGVAWNTCEPASYLSTPMRCFRAENGLWFVKAVLDGEAGRQLFASLGVQYPIVLTRSMRAARRRICQQRRKTKQAGLVASSSAQQLKPQAINICANIGPIHWIPSPARDTWSLRHSYPQSPRDAVARRQGAQAALLSEERLPRVAQAGPAGDWRFSVVAFAACGDSRCTSRAPESSLNWSTPLRRGVRRLTRAIGQRHQHTERFRTQIFPRSVALG